MGKGSRDRRSSSAKSEQLSGRIKWFNPMKGYGFVIPDDEHEREPYDLFVHVSNIAMFPDQTEIDENTPVRFRKVMGSKDRFVAVDVTFD